MGHRRHSSVRRSILLWSWLVAACGAEATKPSQAPGQRADDLMQRARQLTPLHEPPPAVRRGDWLAEHDEAGQTFAEYLECDPMLPEGKRRRIYVTPIGKFDDGQQRILEQSARVLGIWFGLEVVVDDAVPLASIPDFARRKFPHGGWLQLQSRYLLHEVLHVGLPADAACRIGLTATDLWPGDGWNFVFGEASLRHRVGVWSLARNGDPNASEDAYRLCLLRTLKTATHEVAHMFSIRHCTVWSCNMAGANNREESDRQPWRLCPECLPKVLWAMDCAPERRFGQLAAFCERAGLAVEQTYFAAARLRWEQAR